MSVGDIRKNVYKVSIVQPDIEYLYTWQLVF